jgi:hypothetical protein
VGWSVAPPIAYHGADVEAREIFELILKADDAIKYATEEKAAARARQTRTLLAEARREAEAIGNQDLIDQVDRRVADLEALGLKG